MSNASHPKPKWSKRELAALASIPILTLLWAIVVGLSGLGVNWTGREWDFQRTALLGDSFGVVGALMATAAAAFTLATLRGERAENARLRSREAHRDRADAKREAETTFFQLLDLRNSILERVRDTRRAQSQTPVLGQRAIFAIARDLRQTIDANPANTQKHHDDFWQVVEGEVGHYLRFTYHIVRFVTANFDNDRDRYNYVRLLRAQLSNAELELIALNSAFGAGKPFMKAYVEHFSLLHSLPDATIEKLNLRLLFNESAFNTDRWRSVSSEPDDDEAGLTAR